MFPNRPTNLHFFSVYDIRRIVVHPAFTRDTDPYYIADIAVILVSFSIFNLIIGLATNSVCFCHDFTSKFINTNNKH